MNMSFQELSLIWLEYKSYTIKKTSLMQYKRIINHYLNVYLGDMKVCDFTVYDGWREPLCSLYESHHQTAS